MPPYFSRRTSPTVPDRVRKKTLVYRRFRSLTRYLRNQNRALHVSAQTVNWYPARSLTRLYATATGSRAPDTPSRLSRNSLLDLGCSREAGNQCFLGAGGMLRISAINPGIRLDVA